MNDKGLYEVDACIQGYRALCGQIDNITWHNEAKTTATYVEYAMGRMQENPYLIIDLAETAPGKTEYRGYAIYPTWNRSIDKFIKAVNSCGQCPN